VAIAPDWVIKFKLPLRELTFPNVALTLLLLFTKPKQLGPRIFIPNSFEIAIISFSRVSPSAPVSLNPAEIITTFFEPFSPVSLNT